MYFTDDKKLQRFECEMKIVPNFERKEAWEFADSCNECKNYECKLESCMETHCPYLMRKIRSNSIITRDLVETFLLDHPYIPFAHRVIDMLVMYKGTVIRRIITVNMSMTAVLQKRITKGSMMCLLMPKESGCYHIMIALK